MPVWLLAARNPGKKLQVYLLAICLDKDSPDLRPVPVLNRIEAFGGSSMSHSWMQELFVHALANSTTSRGCEVEQVNPSYMHADQLIGASVKFTGIFARCISANSVTGLQSSSLDIRARGVGEMFQYSLAIMKACNAKVLNTMTL